MSFIFGIAIFAAIVLCIWMYGIYAGLIKKKNKAQEAFASIDVQLKKRYDLIPNILAIAQKYMEHERSLMEEVTKLRVQALDIQTDYANIDRKIALDTQIAQKMEQLMVSVENYPQIKADQTMIQAMQTYNEVEEHISAARRFYNSAANELKNAVEIFPSSLFARMLNIKSVDFFKAAEHEKKPVNAADFLK